MALVIGTNCGFVETAPTSDPQGASNYQMDDAARAGKFTSPATAGKVVEIGWYCTNATQEANFEVAIYSHDSGNNRPDAIIGVSRTNAKGTGAGWKTSTVDIEINSETIYWIAIQLDDTTTQTDRDYAAEVGERNAWDGSRTTLDNTWLGTNEYEQLESFYAVWEAGAPSGTNTQINIGDSWKAIASAKINIADSWKDVASMKINIGDTWKTIF